MSVEAGKRAVDDAVPRAGSSFLNSKVDRLRSRVDHHIEIGVVLRCSFQAVGELVRGISILLAKASDRKQ